MSLMLLIRPLVVVSHWSNRSRDDLADDDFGKALPRFSKENFEILFEIVGSLRAIVNRENCTAGQLSLAWFVARGGDDGCLVLCCIDFWNA